MYKIKNKVFAFFILLAFVNIPVTATEKSMEGNIAGISVTINCEEYNTKNYKANDMMFCKYPMILYKDITYVPLTYYNCVLLGLDISVKENIIILEKATFDCPKEYLKDQLDKKAEDKLIMRISPFELNIQGIEYSDEEYPALFYKDIVYLPLTWNVVNNIMQWDYGFSEKGIELYTDSYYYYSEGDSFYEIKEDSGFRAATSYGKTYYQRDGKRVFAAIYHQHIGGPTWDNMKITVGNETIAIPGHTGYGQKQGPIFTVDGEYIYTVHSDRTKYGPCKINIDTGEITYTDELN